jgi:hypothetical protein
MASIPSLKSVINTTIRTETAVSGITRGEISDIHDSALDEIKDRGIVWAADFSAVSSLSPSDTTHAGAEDTGVIYKHDGVDWVAILTPGGGGGGGTGDVLGPANNTDSYVPQWNGTDSLTLKNGVAIGGASGLLQLNGSGAIPALNGALITGLTKNQVGLGSVDNTADSSKPVSTAQQVALDLKAPLASPTFTGTVSGITKTMVGLGNVDNTSDTTKNAAVATLTNKTINGAVINSPSGLVKGDVGLGNVDNTSDANKPVSTATQTALNLKITGGKLTVTSATATSQVLPANCLVKYVVVIPSANLAAFTIGTSFGGEQVLEAMPRDTTDKPSLGIGEYFTGTQTLYFGGITATTTIYIYYE